MPLKEVLSAEQVTDGVVKIASWIYEQYPKDEDVVLAPILTGGMILGTTILVGLEEVDAGRWEVLPYYASSYGEGTTSEKVSIFRVGGKEPYRRRVVLIDDLVDTGRTIDALISHLLYLDEVAEVRVVTLIDKFESRALDLRHDQAKEPDYSAYKIGGNPWLVGYGMDDAGRLRGLTSVFEKVPEEVLDVSS